MSGRYTHSHPCMQHSTQNTELWTCTNTQNSIGGPTEMLYCARMLLKFQRIASASQVCFCWISARTNENSGACCPSDTWIPFRVNHGAAKPSRPVSDSPHLITFPHLDSSIDIFLITSQNWTAFIGCSPECFPRWWHQILPGNFLFDLMGAEPIFYLTSYCSPGLGSLF